MLQGHINAKINQHRFLVFSKAILICIKIKPITFVSQALKQTERPLDFLWEVLFKYSQNNLIQYESPYWMKSSESPQTSPAQSAAIYLWRKYTIQYTLLLTSGNAYGSRLRKWNLDEDQLWPHVSVVSCMGMQHRPQSGPKSIRYYM